ncbi:MAG: ATP-dependent RNA helicase HrpA, partial [Propionicimonas sp.]|nr:ATP-dependent RNA helicase HrpA [Propionicimonas sp.]
DPRLGRMLVEAERQGCLKEVQAVVAGLAIQDPRERPGDAQPAADAAHRRFWAPLAEGGDASPDGSDIAALLRLWQYLRERRRALSGNAFRRLCRDEYLNFLRVREWQDLHSQLRQACDELSMSRNAEPAGLDRVHVAVLSGLLSHVGLLDVAPPAGQQQRPRRRPGPPEYLGARGSRFAVNPGSSAARTRPPLVMAVELVETSRLWARTVAPIEADWVEEVGGHLLSRSYSEPRWSARGGQCVATERVTLLGVPIVAGRTVPYGRIDPVVAREVFIQSALVEGQWRTRHHFWARNQAVREEAADLAERTRRRDLLADDATIAAFYEARIPAEIVSVAHFDTWWRTARRSDEHLLDLSLDDLVLGEADAGGFPTHWRIGDLDLPVDYTFDPGSGRDGVTVTIPLETLNRVRPEPFSWQVPGLREELATTLVRGLPKQWRAQLVPAPDTARRAVAWLGQDLEPSEPFWLALGRALTALTGVQVPADAWAPEAVDDHLRVRFEVVRPSGEVAASGRDLASLGAELGGQVAATLNRAARHLVHQGAKDWEFGTLPARIDQPVVGYPGLADRTDRVGVQVFADEESARRAHRAGLRRLIALTTVDPTNWVVSRLSNRVKFALATSPYPSVPALLADARLKAIGDGLGGRDVWAGVRDPIAFGALRDQVRGEVAAAMQQAVDLTGDLLVRHGEVLQRLTGVPEPVRRDVTEQLAGLVYPGFIAATRARHWPRLPVYLQAVQRRLETLGNNPGREAEALAVITELEDEYAERCAGFPPGPLPEPVDDVGWLIEELRVGLFAQGLGTAVPVSAKRVRTALGAIGAA